VKHQLSQKNIHLPWLMFSNRLENSTLVLIHVLYFSNHKPVLSNMFFPQPLFILVLVQNSC
jgi:hypothetical protein